MFFTVTHNKQGTRAANFSDANQKLDTNVNKERELLNLNAGKSTAWDKVDGVIMFEIKDRYNEHNIAEGPT